MSKKKSEGTLALHATHRSVVAYRRPQCDEACPTCSSCGRKGLECAHELPMGQTRTQALIQSEQGLREGLRSHVSLICALRRVGSDEATQIFCRIRRRDYDEALLGRNPAFGSNRPTSEVFPWGDPAHGDKGILSPDLETPSSIPILHDARPDRAMSSQLRPTFVDPDTVGLNYRCQVASVYITAGSGFPPRLSLDKILSKSSEDRLNPPSRQSSSLVSNGQVTTHSLTRGYSW